MIDLDARVITPYGPGKVIWRRLKGPDYIKVESYKVLLDSRSRGVVIPAALVKGI